MFTNTTIALNTFQLSLASEVTKKLLKHFTNLSIHSIAAQVEKDRSYASIKQILFSKIQGIPFFSDSFIYIGIISHTKTLTNTFSIFFSIGAIFTRPQI